MREDIERADAKAVSAALSRDLVRPYIDLNFGPQARYPTINMGRADVKDVAQMTATAQALVPLGLKVRAQDILEAGGFTEPQPGDDILQAPAPATPAPAPQNPQAELQHLVNSPSVASAIAAAVAGQHDAISRAAQEQLGQWHEVMEVPVEQIRALAAQLQFVRRIQNRTGEALSASRHERAATAPRRRHLPGARRRCVRRHAGAAPVRCEQVKLPGGGPAFVCGRGRQPRPKCSRCGKPADKLCDFVIERRHGGNHRTCDKPLCSSCAVSGGRNVDYCPDHRVPETQPSLAL